MIYPFSLLLNQNRKVNTMQNEVTLSTGTQALAPITVASALKDAIRAIRAVEYLEHMAQLAVNADGKVIAEKVNMKEDINASDIFASWKDKRKVSKTVAALKFTIKFAEVAAKNEAKLNALETTATKIETVKIVKTTPTLVPAR